MIAASDPQEFVPSGRRQALRHPGPFNIFSKKPPNNNNDDLLLDKFEKVSLKEDEVKEWWMLRKAPNDLLKYSNNSVDEQQNIETNTKDDNNKSYLPPNSEFFDESFKSTELSSNKFSKRVSDVNLSRMSTNKRFSNESRNESKSSFLLANKSFSATNQLLSTDKSNKFSTKTEIGYIEDELYVKGNTVIWSQGLINSFNDLDNGRKTICCYTSQFPVKHALWCKFYYEKPNYDSNLYDINNTDDSVSGEELASVCIIDSYNIRVFATNGEDFVTAIPFEISKIWTTKYGLFIEKHIENQSRNLNETKATLYSLAHPLDEIRPVALNNCSHLQVLNNSNFKIVFTNDNPSLCMIYDKQTRQHSIYRIRKIKSIEKIEFIEKVNSTCPSSMSLSNKLRNRLSMWENLKNTNNIPSPFNSRPASAASFSHVPQSRSQSSMATLSRCQTPKSSNFGSPWLQRISRLNTSVPFNMDNLSVQHNCTYFDNSKAMSHLHMHPQICLDYLWTDQYNLQDENTGGPATKVFLCDDLANQWYICYILLSKYQLSIVRIDFTNFDNINFGVLTSISAKDAIPIPHLHMLAILEHNGNVTLYSGLTTIGKLHINGTLTQHTPSPYVRRNLPQFNSPYPRRSSLLPHFKQSDPVRFDEHLLSPVLPENTPRTTNVLSFQLEGECSTKATLNGLRDSIENKFTLVYSDGSYYRITLPLFASSKLVESCLIVLKQCLQRDAIATMFSRWYANRNSLGSQNLNDEDEWNLFTDLIFELIGYDDIQDSNYSKDYPMTPSINNPKRAKKSNLSTNDDWLFVLNSDLHSRVSNDLLKLLKLDDNNKLEDNKNELETELNFKINTNLILFPYIKIIHYSLHLLYEDLKLNQLRYEDLKKLAKFLNKLSCDLNLVNYSVHYWKDFPDICSIKINQTINDMKNAHLWSVMDDDKPVDIMQYIYNLLLHDNNDKIKPFPFLRNVNKRSKDIVEICGLISKENSEFNKKSTENLIQIIEINPNLDDQFISLDKLGFNDGTIAEQVVLLITKKNITIQDLDTLPVAINLLLYSMLWKCRENPPTNWSAESYYLLWRDDLASLIIENTKDLTENMIDKYGIYSHSKLDEILPAVKTNITEPSDGMEETENDLIKLRFSEDTRVREARRMLQSSRPVTVNLVQKPDVSDHDYIEEQERLLYTIGARTMSLPVGRGMLTLRISTPVITEPLAAPPLCLTGKATPHGTTVEINHAESPSNLNLWPLFHNGVANGLKIASDAHNIDNTWIIFNKPKSLVEHQMEHAGFLMALGLNGHLKNLAILSTYNYLVQLHDMTSIGVLLGLASAFRGTCDTNLTKILSIHTEALLPPTLMELDVPQNLQVAAILGIGLVYQGSGHRHMIEVLLSEIGRPPGPEMENSIDRESYSLAAGLALGLVILKQGELLTSLSDLNVSDTLHYYMIGGNKRPLTGPQKDKYKVASFQIREGSCVNLDVTAPGATIALGLMYFGSGNKAVADWMSPPSTQYLLDFVRPDLLMFRILARALILWDNVRPEQKWIENQIPQTIKPYCMVKPSPSVDVDYEAMNQAYCNIVAGACFALGLKYAGTADINVYNILLHYANMYIKLTVRSIAELAGKPTIETCLGILMISLGMVMAGTGDIKIMRIARLLRRRVGNSSNSGNSNNSHMTLTYGTQMAIHMAVGLLFLGGGRYTLSNTPENIAALICAFYPKFPTHSNDNKYHLQAFRHLYVLAVEPRLLIPKDVYLLKSHYANVTVVKLDGTKLKIKCPGIIPDLNTLQKVSIKDERYWPVVFEKGRNWNLLSKILSTSGYIHVKQRAGCLCYTVDKLGFHSQLARTLTQSETVPWNPSATSIKLFTSDQSIKYFCDYYLYDHIEFTQIEIKLKQMMTKMTYDAVVKDKLIVIPIYITLIKTIMELNVRPNNRNLWQIKLLNAQILKRFLSCNLISTEVMMALEQEVVGILEKWDDLLKVPLQSYMSGCQLNFESDIRKKLAAYVVYYDIPYNFNLNQTQPLEVICNLNSNKCSIETIQKIMKVCNFV